MLSELEFGEQEGAAETDHYHLAFQQESSEQPSQSHFFPADTLMWVQNSSYKGVWEMQFLLSNLHSSGSTLGYFKSILGYPRILIWRMWGIGEKGAPDGGRNLDKGPEVCLGNRKEADWVGRGKDFILGKLEAAKRS